MKKYSFEKTVLQLKQKENDYKNRTIPFAGGIIEVFYISQLCDKKSLSDFVIRPLLLHCQGGTNFDPEFVSLSVLQAEDCAVHDDASKIEYHVLQGMVVLLFSNSNHYIVANFKMVEKRATPQPQINYTLRGPQDCFTENLDANLSLMRYRIKDKNLNIIMYQLGRRTQTKVAVLYIQDVVNPQVVTELKKRLKKIDMDGVVESGELQSCLLADKPSIFPTIGGVERSDFATNSLLEGKVIILVEGSGLALLVPKVFVEYFHSCDDIYDNPFFGMYSRLIRYMAGVIALTAPSLFIAITSFHPDVLPTEYAITLAQMRSSVPISALTSVLLIEIITELLRESLLRVPKQIGSAVGIVGAIVIGQAAISAGIFSPLLLIVASSTLLASFAIPDYTLVSSIRILKFFLIALTGVFGFFGFTIGMLFIMVELTSLSSFGVPYMAPWAPLIKYDFKRTFIDNLTLSPLRPTYLQDKNKTRLGTLPKKQ